MKKAAARTAGEPGSLSAPEPTLPPALTGVSGGNDDLNAIGNPPAGADLVDRSQTAKAADVAAAIMDLGRKCNQLRTALNEEITARAELETIVLAEIARRQDLEAKLVAAGVIT